MPRGRRYILPGFISHITHRCHNREFLLQFKRDRTAYRRMLWERLNRFNISLFTYCITSNHVHLLLRPDPSDPLEILSRFMQSLAGDFSQYFNRRKSRQNAFWGDRYHATMVESGEHLWRCLPYIDLNMVRAGEVEHPRDWEWTGYRELMGLRERYRLIDQAKLLDLVGATSVESFRKNYASCVEEALRRAELERESKWTECLAVGSETFARKAGSRIGNRMEVDVSQDQQETGSWTVRESDPLESIYGVRNDR